ncbi:restriction endonuclease (plasmid) [Acinetobacter junii]|uniref:restriction endonuclease n=1 Tax=Acinetobacter junii TaxID=40215 RepID=UPI000B3C6C9D|nr:restriction endonuclease [Acinetobacter junii]AWA46575.1 restriction endonuclease [Acinetobacter junii]
MNYEDFLFKVPVESLDYRENSDFVIQQIESIIKEAIDSQRNKIFINTNLRLGLPMENINKIAGPFVEAWAFEVFYEEFQKQQSEYDLVNVETMTRLNMADVVLQFKKRSTAVVANVDVKATSKDIEKSGKAPNITSYSRIRTAYVKDPDFMFVILSLKHKVYSDRNIATGLMDGVMEVVDFNAYDLKYISALDISYNPALGTGQIQIKDIHYVTRQDRTVWEFCQLLDSKYLRSRDKTVATWEREARKNGWIKDD